MAGDSVETRNRERLQEARMEKAIVFYCKGCGEMFFATVKNERNIRDSQKEIIQYLADGHRMEEINSDKVSMRFGGCKC